MIGFSVARAAVPRYAFGPLGARALAALASLASPERAPGQALATQVELSEDGSLLLAVLSTSERQNSEVSQTSEFCLFYVPPSFPFFSSSSAT